MYWRPVQAGARVQGLGGKVEVTMASAAARLPL